jgi:transposase InsO family protein
MMWVSFEVEEHPDLNALMEKFFSTLKTELVYRHSWRTREQAGNACGSVVLLMRRAGIKVLPNRRRPRPGPAMQLEMAVWIYG